MKVIDLLNMIAKGEIKNETKIKCSDFPVSYIYKNGTLGFYSQDVFYELTLKDILENIDYATYEIIEEKELEKLSMIYNGNAEDEIMRNRYILNELVREFNKLKKDK